MLLKQIKLSLILLFLVSLLNAQATGLAGWDICLDPGHSIKQNMGVFNYSEAMKNLYVSRNLRDILQTYSDIDTVYVTRNDSIYDYSLSSRTTYANSLKNYVGATWFHSIHSNAGGASANSTLMLWAQNYNGSEHKVGSKAMADIMVEWLTAGMRTYTSGSIGDCVFYGESCPRNYVTKYTTMPGELSEAGFHTNERQNQLNMNAEWKRMEAWTFYWSILDYHDIDWPAVGIAAGIITDYETYQPINGATVQLNGETYTTDTYESLFNQYSTDPEKLRNGFYYFEGLPNTSLEMVVSAPDYYPDTLLVTIVDTFITFKDIKLVSSVPPYITGSLPVEGDTSYPAIDDIIIKFSRTMDRSSVEAAFSISPAVPGVFLWKDNYRELTYRPDALDYKVDYTITIADLAFDSYDHYLDGDGDGTQGGDYVLQFRSSAEDTYPPEILSVYPAATSSNIELQPIISFVYNEIIGPDSLVAANIKLQRLADYTYVPVVVENHRVKKRSVINVFPVSPLPADEVFVSRIAPGLADLSGNATTSYKSFSFQTGTTGWDITGIDNFNSGVTSNWWEPASSGSTTGYIADSTGRTVRSDIVNHLTSSTNALEINYGWDLDKTEWLLREYLSGGTPRNVIFNSSYRMQAYVFGTGSGVKLRFAVDDHYPATAAEYHEASPWFTIDWYGWKLVSWDIANESGTWLGDGNLDGNLRFDSIQLTYAPGSDQFGSVIIDDLRLIKPVTVGVEAAGFTQPLEYSLAANYPNPFNPVTNISFTIPEAGQISLAVYDISGRLVRTLVRHDLTAGQHHVEWDGTNNNGELQASGVYFYRLSGDDVNLSRRMTLIK
ncbi:MAG: Ig-like domain-containing protein [Candidatus Neomarinimicrobiota bacterium]